MIARSTKAAILALRPAFTSVFETGILVTGAGLIAFGAWQIYRPAGYIVGGMLLIAGVILQARGNG